MAEPTSPRVEFDTDLDAWTIDLEPPGPAGTAPLQVSPRLQLLVDIAEPGRIAAIISSDAPGYRLDTAELNAAATIFGGAVLDDLPGRHSGGRQPRRPTSPDELAGVRDELARLALAEDVTIDTTDEAVRAVAGAEAAVLAESLRADWNLDIGRPESTASAARHLISAYPTLSERLTAQTRDQLTDLMLRLASFAPSAVAAQLRSMSETVTRSGRSRDPKVGSSRAYDAPVGQVTFDRPGSTTDSGYVRLDRRLFSPTLLDSSARADVTWNPTAGDLTVRCRVARGAYLAGLGTQWVRAYRPDSRTVLALAPLEPIQPTSDEQWAAARLHVGRQDPTRLAVDVTDAPQQRPPSIVRRSIEAATLIGSDAARLERSALPTSIDAWESCADTWRAAADPDRATIALARAANLARTAGDKERGAALLARVGRLTVTWAAERLNPMPPPKALVADFMLSGSADSWQ